MKKNIFYLLLIAFFVSFYANAQVTPRITAEHSGAVIWKNGSDDCTDPATYEISATVVYYNSCLDEFRKWNGSTWSDWGSSNAIDVESLGTTQIFDIGDIGLSDISDGFNGQTFTGDNVTLQNQADGYVIVNAIMDSEEVQYLFVGEGGDYGLTGNSVALEDDFLLINEQPALSNVWTTAFGGQPAVLNTGNVYHNGVIYSRGLRVSGGLSGGISNTDTSNLYLTGNQGMFFNIGNQNNGFFTFKSAGTITSYGVGSNKLAYFSKNFGGSLSTTGDRILRSIEINDNVTFNSVNNPNTKYTSLYLNPVFGASLDLDNAYSIITERGNVEFNDGDFILNDLEAGTAINILGIDANNKVVLTDAGSSGSSNIENVEIDAATYTLLESDINAFKQFFIADTQTDVTITIPETTLTSDTGLITIQHKGTGEITIQGDTGVTFTTLTTDTDKAIVLVSDEDDVWFVRALKEDVNLDSYGIPGFVTEIQEITTGTLGSIDSDKLGIVINADNQITEIHLGYDFSYQLSNGVTQETNNISFTLKELDTDKSIILEGRQGSSTQSSGYKYEMINEKVLILSNFAEGDIIKITPNLIRDRPQTYQSVKSIVLNSESSIGFNTHGDRYLLLDTDTPHANLSSYVPNNIYQVWKLGAANYPVKKSIPNLGQRVYVEDEDAFYIYKNTGSVEEWVIDSNGSGTDDQTATEVPFTPYSTITSTDTQSAIEELKDEVDGISGGTEMLTKKKTADQPITSNNVVALDTELQVELEANSYYSAEFKLIYEADAASDFRTQLEMPSGADGMLSAFVHTTTTASQPLTSIMNHAGNGAGSLRYSVIVVTIYTDVAGTFGLKWAQNTSDPIATILKKGSSLTVIKL